MDIVVKINNEDVTSYIYDLSTIPIYARNYDFSQIFTSLTFTLSYKYKKHGEIEENETIVELFLDDNCIYTGYIESSVISGYYRKKIKVQHITQKLSTIKAISDVKDITGVYTLKPEFTHTEDNINAWQLLKDITLILGYDNLSAPNNYINENNELAEILSHNEILNNIKYWGQSVEFSELRQVISFLLDPENAPSLWDLLALLQKTFHFSCRFESIYSVDKRVNIVTPGHFYANSFDTVAEQGGIDPSFSGLKNKINITNENLLSDIPTKTAVPQKSDSISNTYIDKELYTNMTTAESPEDFENIKGYELIKFKESSIEYPEHFIFMNGSDISMVNLPFVLKTNFVPLQEKFVVDSGIVSIYNRWMKPQDYSAIGIYQAGFEKASVNYLNIVYYLPEWDNQILTKMPRKIDYIVKNDAFKITQDEPGRN